MESTKELNFNTREGKLEEVVRLSKILYKNEQEQQPIVDKLNELGKDLVEELSKLQQFWQDTFKAREHLLRDIREMDEKSEQLEQD